MDWTPLRRVLEGPLVLPGERTYDVLRRPFNYRIDPFPAAVARCLNEDDVVACVRFAVKNDIAITMRSGGHGAEGYSSVDGALVIDQSGMQRIRVDLENDLVHVTGGCEWGQVDIATYPRGRVAGGGGCAAVGAGGLTQGGGFGPVSRTWGLTADQVVSARVVTSRDQKAIVVDADNDAELFWALRGGGGGNWGVVTEFTYRLHPIGTQLLGGMAVYPWEQAQELFVLYRDWMLKGGDPRLTPLPMVAFGGDNKPMAAVSAFYNGDPDTGMSELTSLLDTKKVGDPVQGPLDTVFSPGTLPAYTGTESTTAWPGSGQYWRNGFLENAFPDAAINTMLTWFNDCPRPPTDESKRHGFTHQPQNDLSFGFIESLGGAIAEVPRDDTAFYWRDRLFSFSFIGVFDPENSGWSQDTKTWADGFLNAMGPYLSGAAYVNYMQAELPDWKKAYYGGHVSELERIKREYDPAYVFRFPQDVLKPDGAGSTA